MVSKSELRKALMRATGCGIQNKGWCCGTCFFAIDDRLTNQDWQAVLLKRGDYKRGELDNLPEDINGSLIKVIEYCGKFEEKGIQNEIEGIIERSYTKRLE